MSSSASTGRGRETRARIVGAAADLMHHHGVHATSVEDVLAQSRTGKGQFYHYFPSKEALVAEVIDLQLQRILAGQQRYPLHNLAGLAAWFEAIVVSLEEDGTYAGCPLGSIAAEVVSRSDRLYAVAAVAFERWQATLAAGLDAMRENGELRPETDTRAVAVTIVAGIQGGYLLAQAARNAAPMRTVLEATLLYVRTFTP